MVVLVLSFWQSVLGFAVREDGEPHNCLNDARAAMKLVLAKLEHGFDDPIEASGNNVCVNKNRLLLLSTCTYHLLYHLRCLKLSWKSCCFTKFQFMYLVNYCLVYSQEILVLLSRCYLSLPFIYYEIM